jgi:L-threonylcarbamoyladenylate synthase
MYKVVSNAEASQLLLNGELVALPTETVYGLAACFDNPQAIDAIFTTKGRPNTNPLIVHIHDTAQVNELCSHVPEDAQKLMEKFWPGPLTIVLPAAAHISRRITAGQHTIALRMPDHLDFLDVLQQTGKPLAAPSANPSNRISPTNAQMVQAYFPDIAVVDGGTCSRGLESTIVGFYGEKLICYRPGSIPIDIIEKYLNRELHEEHPDQIMPGNHVVHYSPNALVELTTDAFKTLDKKRLEPGSVIITQRRKNFPSSPYHYLALSSNGELDVVAKNLYKILYEADISNPPLILVELAPNTGLGIAINNRLYRAAGIKRH